LDDADAVDPSLTVATALEPSFNAQLKDPNMIMKANGLIKKTLSFAFEDLKDGKMRNFHVVSYFKKEDVLNGLLPIPSKCASLKNVQIPSEVGAHIVTSIAYGSILKCQI
jgi:hypothetical protein